MALKFFITAVYLLADNSEPLDCTFNCGRSTSKCSRVKDIVRLILTVIVLALIGIYIIFFVLPGTVSAKGIKSKNSRTHQNQIQWRGSKGSLPLLHALISSLNKKLITFMAMLLVIYNNGSKIKT